MKKTLHTALFLLLCSLFCTSCAPKTPEDMAKKAIKNWMNDNLSAPGSYTCLRCGPLDSMFSDARLDTTYLRLMKEFRQASDYSVYHANLSREHSIYQMIDQTRLHLDSSILYLDQAGLIREELIAFVDKYQGEFTGWKMRHYFRHKGLDSMVESEMTFFFDKELTTVTDVEFDPELDF